MNSSPPMDVRPVMLPCNLWLGMPTHFERDVGSNVTLGGHVDDGPGGHRGQEFLFWPALRRDITSPLGRGRREAAGEGGTTSTNHWICGKPLTLDASRLDLSRRER